MVICVIPLLVNLVSILVFDSYMIFDESQNAAKNVLWFILESLYSMPTGILLAIIYKRGKPAAMTCFFLILFSLIMQMF